MLNLSLTKTTEGDGYERALSNLEAMSDLISGLMPVENPAVLAEAKRLCRSITIYDSYVSEKLSKLERYLEQYFSVRKWRSHPRGAEGVMRDIRATIGSMRHQITSLSQQKPL